MKDWVKKNGPHATIGTIKVTEWSPPGKKKEIRLTERSGTETGKQPTVERGTVFAMVFRSGSVSQTSMTSLFVVISILTCLFKLVMRTDSADVSDTSENVHDSFGIGPVGCRQVGMTTAVGGQR